MMTPAKWHHHHAMRGPSSVPLLLALALVLPFGPDVDFRLLRVKFLETISSPRPSNFQGNFREMRKKVRC